MADKIVVMRDGHILQVGSPTDLYENPLDVFTARFIGSPSMNMMEGTLANNSLSIDGVGVTGLTMPAHEGKVLVGIRPHDLLVGETSGAGVSGTGLVEAVEPLGAETLVHLKLGQTLVTATAPGRVVPAIGSTVSVHADAGALYLFDAANEKVLGRA